MLTFSAEAAKRFNSPEFPRNRMFLKNLPISPYNSRFWPYLAYLAICNQLKIENLPEGYKKN